MGAGRQTPPRTGTKKEEGQSTIARLVEGQTTLLITGGIFLLFLIRVYTVARSPTTALEMLKAVGPAQALLAIALWAIPYAFGLAAIVALALAVDAWKQKDRPESILWAIPMAVCALIYIGFVTPASNGSILFVLGAAVVLAELESSPSKAPAKQVDQAESTFWRANRKGSRMTSTAGTRGRIRGLRFTILTLVILIVVVIIVSNAPVWLPAERVDVKPDQTLVGYVLVADDGGFATILLDDDRSIVRLRSDQLEERVVCEPKGDERPLVFRMLDLGDPEVPTCDEEADDTAERPESD